MPGSWYACRSMLTSIRLVSTRMSMALSEEKFLTMPQYFIAESSASLMSASMTEKKRRREESQMRGRGLGRYEEERRIEGKKRREWYGMEEGKARARQPSRLA